jgi:pimeloyl-ACP methyl ester carboxylesterase
MRAKALTGILVGLVASGLTLAPLTTSAVATAAPTASTTGAASAAAPAVPTPPALDWGKCKDKGLRQAKAQCTMLTVPLDYANPTGEKIQLAVSRVLHSKKTFKGAVFTNPGGPGGSGLGLSTLGQYVPKKAGLNYDWYGIDPRGVGSSVPALSCDTKYFGFDRPSYTPKTQADLDYWTNKTANYATACANSSAKQLLGHVKTTDTVMDFESLRIAIGQPQVTYYGFSYGTYIGQVWATMYPTSLKAMILDGVVDASRAWYPANLDQDYAFEKTFTAFFKWMGKYDSVYHMGKTGKQVRKAYDKLKKKLAKKPAMGKIGPDELDDAILNAGYYNLTWLDVAKNLSDLAVKGDAKGIKAAYRSGNPYGVKDADNGYAMYVATECSEATWPTDLNTWISDNNAANQTAPMLTWPNAWFNMPCRTWSVPGTPAFQVTGAYTGPVLLTAEQYDAATPFSGALATRAIFSNSALIEGKKGTSHAVSLYGVGCVDDSIATLLKKGTLPTRKAGNGPDLSCRGLKAPNPTAKSTSPMLRSGAVAARPLPTLYR